MENAKRRDPAKFEMEKKFTEIKESVIKETDCDPEDVYCTASYPNADFDSQYFELPLLINRMFGTVTKRNKLTSNLHSFVFTEISFAKK